MGSTIFIVDSSPAVRRMVEQISAPEGYEVIGFQDGPTALDAARKMTPALIIADYHLDNITFSGFCKEVGKQDNLAETLLVSLVDATDRLDESKLRSLGVRSCIKKPFQGDQLLETIRGVLAGGAKSAAAKTAKKRQWPPVTTATDNEDEADTSIDPAANEIDAEPDDKVKESTTMTPASSRATATPPPAAGSGGEEMMKGLFDHLLQSAVQQADRKIAELLPASIAKEVSGQVRAAVQTAVQEAVQEEVAKQIAAAFSPDKMRSTLREMVQEELSRQSTEQTNHMESAMRRTLSDLAPPLIEQSVEKQVRELTESTVQTRLPDALRAQLSSIDQMVKDEVRKATSAHARETAERIVREMAQDPIQQAVQRIVPDVAETQVREEIKRLSAAD